MLTDNKKHELESRILENSDLNLDDPFVQALAQLSAKLIVTALDEYEKMKLD